MIKRKRCGKCILKGIIQDLGKDLGVQFIKTALGLPLRKDGDVLIIYPLILKDAPITKKEKENIQNGGDEKSK